MAALISTPIVTATKPDKRVGPSDDADVEVPMSVRALVKRILPASISKHRRPRITDRWGRALSYC